MNTRNIASILALMLALVSGMPALAQPGSVRDFQLPAPTPSPTPQVQGPVDTEGPRPFTPPGAAARPSEAATNPAPAPSQVPSAATTPATPRQQQPVPTRPATATRAPLPPAAQAPLANEATDGATNGVTDGATAIPADPVARPPVNAFPHPSLGSAPIVVSRLAEFWPWIAAFAAALAAVACGALAWRRRRRADASEAAVAELPVEREIPARSPAPVAALAGSAIAPPPPQTTPPPASPPQAAPPIASAGNPVTIAPIAMQAEIYSLSRSMLNATFHFRLMLHNRSANDLAGLAIHADVTTAHGKVPVSEQLAELATQLPQMIRVDHVEAGGWAEASGEFRLPIGEIRPIAQGQALVYVPLLRVRVEAPGIAPALATFVIGMQQAPGARLQPFRLDEMAQVYRQIGCRALA